MGGVYKRTQGVQYTKFEEGSDNPTVEIENAELEELYYEKYSGIINVSFSDRDGGAHRVTIPIRANATWNGFVNSLPTWDFDDE